MEGGRKILLVDDEQDIRKTYKTLFNLMGHEIICAEDGEKGFAEFLKGQFDLVLTDLSMPRLDGIGLTRKIRETDSKTPILIMTGYGNERQQEAYGAGCNEFLFKPFAMSFFEEKLEQYSPLRN